MMRVRLLLGLMCLLIILLAIGLYSINQCSELGARMEAFRQDHDTAGRSFQQLRQGSSGMTGALLSRVVGERDRGLRDFISARAVFARALSDESANPNKSTEESELLAGLTDSYNGYEKRCLQFLNSPLSKEEALDKTASQLGRDTSDILGLIDRLMIAHEKAFAERRPDSGKDITRTIRLIIFMMLVAVVVAVYATFRLSQGVLNPLKVLTSSIQKIGEGNLDLEVPVLSKDELGALAISFNQMAARLRQYQISTSEELVRLNQTVRVTLASFPDPIFVLNSSGAVEFRNPEADELAVKLLFSGVTRLPQKLDEKVEEVMASGEDYLPTLLKDAIKFHLDGQDRYFLPRIVLLRDDKGERFGVAVIIANVTRMMLLDHLKSNLIATVSHELKTPLTSVRVTLYLLSELALGPLTAKQTEMVSTARDDADRLLKTLNDLLDLAKLEQGQPLDLRLVAPESLVSEAERSVRDQAAVAQITLKKELDVDLPKISIDQQRMAYVFANLLTNAVKYSPPQTTVTITALKTKTREGNPAVRFGVKDQGTGISAGHQEHVFQRFYRVPGTNKSGAGLGLSIAREVVLAHQGEIGVLSEEGKGSEFFFVIPLPGDKAPERV